MTEVHLADVRQEDGYFIIAILIGTDRAVLPLPVSRMGVDTSVAMTQ
jgi:hypothetical protein